MEIGINPLDKSIEIGEQEGIEFGASKTETNTDYNKLNNKPSINDIILEGNKTLDDLGIMGKYMETIELSTDIENPTEITDYINKSGIYVAKNAGILGFQGEPITVLAKGQFFKVMNLQEYGSVIGEEISDEDNLIQIQIAGLEGYDYILYKNGTNDWEDAADINSLNINDYVNIDTSNLLKTSNISSTYGIKLLSNYLAIQQASNTEIDSATNTYHPITPNNIAYAVQKKGASYFADKTDFETLQTTTNNLISEIETILESVVTVNE